MAQGVRKCKVCGVEYPYCKTLNYSGSFRWQDVACCPEHASEYFHAIAISRGEVIAEAEEQAEVMPESIEIEKNFEPDEAIDNEEVLSEELEEVEPARHKKKSK